MDPKLRNSNVSIKPHLLFVSYSVDMITVSTVLYENYGPLDNVSGKSRHFTMGKNHTEQYTELIN